MSADDERWTREFQIESAVELDFVIGQTVGWPIGMESRSPPEFKRRVLAAMISHQLRLKSIDYTLKNYVDADEYERNDETLGATVSHYLRGAVQCLKEELCNLHTQGELTFGVLGAELTLYRVPHALDTARLLSNRGLLLEVLPLLRLCIEMIAWANVVFYLKDEEKIIGLKAQSCISKLKDVYSTAGQIYGFLSQFAHWGHAIHREFIDISEAGVGVLNASVRYRAISLASCLVVVDLCVEVAKALYQKRSLALISRVQGGSYPDPARYSYRYARQIAEMTKLKDVEKIQMYFEQ